MKHPCATCLSEPVPLAPEPHGGGTSGVPSRERAAAVGGQEAGKRATWAMLSTHDRRSDPRCTAGLGLAARAAEGRASKWAARLRRPRTISAAEWGEPRKQPTVQSVPAPRATNSRGEQGGRAWPPRASHRRPGSTRSPRGRHPNDLRNELTIDGLAVAHRPKGGRASKTSAHCRRYRPVHPTSRSTVETPTEKEGGATTPCERVGRSTDAPRSSAAPRLS